jgi:hypothetical protein
MATNVAIKNTGVQGPAGPAPSGTQNQVVATPNGSSGPAGLRSLVLAEQVAHTLAPQKMVATEVTATTHK